jgi:MFS family permease
VVNDELDEHAAEQWFRRRGLPAVVRGRPEQLLVRIVPALVLVGLAQLIFAVLGGIDGGTDADFDRRMENTGFVWAYNSLLVGWVVIPALAGWLAARWVRRRIAGRRGITVAAIAVALFVVAVPTATRLLWPDDWAPADVVVQAVLVVGLLGMAFVGGGSILGWALRAAFRQAQVLGVLASRALPLLLLFTIFGFFTTEIWQVCASLPRSQMWLVVGFFVVVAVVFLSSMLSDEVRTLTKSHRVPFAADALRGTPFGPIAAGPGATELPRVPLRKLEQANMVLVLMLTQVLQTVVFATLMFVFFVVFGAVAIRNDVIKAWIARPPSGGVLFGIQLPVSNELLQVSLFIAAFSGLYFAASTVTDAKYRESFFDPLADHMAASLSARDIYLARLGRS